MSTSKDRDNFYELFFLSERKISILEYLNSSPCDIILKVNTNTDKYEVLYNLDGKYVSPQLKDTSYSAFYNYVYRYLTQKEDLEAIERISCPTKLAETNKNSPFPNFAYERYRIKLLDGSWSWAEKCNITGKENGCEEGVYLMYIFDIQNIKNREVGLTTYHAEINGLKTDEITKLPLERQFIEAAQEVLEQRTDMKWCLLAVDIEHFRLFDEWYGREKGDYLLSKIGEALIADEDVIVPGYLGSDDFVVLMEYDKKKIEDFYEKIREIIVSFELSFGFMPVIGVAEIEGGLTLNEVFDRASIASSKAKTDIKKRIYYYNPKIHENEEHEYRVLSAFMKALKNDEITFFLQPQCRISTKKIVGAEALARWLKPDGTIVPPLDFIPLLEKYHFIADLDQYLWEKICQWINSVREKGLNPVPISVNISRADIYSLDVAATFEELVTKYDIPRNLLKLEITESAYSETTALIDELVKHLREEGFMVLMDDFGTGYSSLNMLSTLKVDAIKLDALFLNLNPDDYQKGIHILESVINMAKIISVPIVVEGVETKEQTDFLEDLGCRYVQGYYFYKAMPKEQFEQLIADKNNIDPRGFVVKINEQFRLREFLDQNVYSDSMLNNILGAVAIYSVHGEDIDIIRFNQQFYETVDVPDFIERLVSIQKYMPKDDIPIIHNLFKEAKENKLNGSTGVVRFYKTDGTLSTYIMHYYYLGMKEGTDRFYGSANNVTELTDFKEKLNLISMYSSDSFIFMKRVNNSWNYVMAAHGLKEELGLTSDELESELNSGTFTKRFVNQKRVPIDVRHFYENTNKHHDFTLTFRIHVDNNEIKNVMFKYNFVNDVANNIEYLLTIKVVKK